jgi:hypothetical protein
MSSATRVSRFVILTAIAAFAAMAAFAGSASAKRFVTQDGNVACIMRAHFVRCDMSKHKWESPPKPKSCEFDYGSSFYIDRKGRSGFACVSDATGATMEYPPGTKFQTGENVCHLRKHGKVLCKHNGGKDGGFNISRKRYILF